MCPTKQRIFATSPKHVTSYLRKGFAVGFLQGIHNVSQTNLIYIQVDMMSNIKPKAEIYIIYVDFWGLIDVILGH